jgi:phospholipase C
LSQLSVQDWDQVNRAQRWPSTITQLSDNPDIILISEAFSKESEVALAKLPQLYPYQSPNVGQDCSGAGWHNLTGKCSNSPFVIRGGVVILSKYPIMTQKAHVFNTPRKQLQKKEPCCRFGFTPRKQT